MVLSTTNHDFIVLRQSILELRTLGSLLEVKDSHSEKRSSNLQRIFINFNMKPDEINFFLKISNHDHVIGVISERSW